MLEFLQGLFTLTGAANRRHCRDCGGRHLALSKIGLRRPPRCPTSCRRASSELPCGT